MSDIRNEVIWTNILIIAETESGRLTAASRELFGKGRELADQLGVWVMVYPQPFPSDEGKEIFSYGADLVLKTALPSTLSPAEDLSSEAEQIAALIETKRPEIVLFAESDRAAALAARVAQRFRTGLVTGCTSLTLDLTERRLVAACPVYQGRLMEESVWPTKRPQIATLAPGAFPEGFPDPYREGTVETVG
ncbi:MAG: hypothetical protein HY282_06380 [Nitrospirae bacterium]|nr:hypothetical protein [Candidatus Manganitrophaceae bacterium]